MNQLVYSKKIDIISKYLFNHKVVVITDDVGILFYIEGRTIARRTHEYQ